MSKTVASLPHSSLTRDVVVHRVLDTPNPQIAIFFRTADGTHCVRISDVNCYEFIRRMTDVLFRVDD